MKEIFDYRWFSMVGSGCLMLHNAVSAWYVYYMIEMYFTMASRNMHAVEDSIIGSVYDKARYHKIEFKEQQFYYTRSSKWANFCEMMGTSNVLRWLLPFPLEGHNNDLSRTEKEVTKGFEYMKFSKEALRTLIVLEYKIEEKIEQDLINSGFRLKKRTQIPKSLAGLLGEIKLD